MRSKIPVSRIVRMVLMPPGVQTVVPAVKRDLSISTIAAEMCYCEDAQTAWSRAGYWQCWLKWKAANLIKQETIYQLRT